MADPKEEIVYVSFIEPVKIGPGLARYAQGSNINWHARGVRVGNTVIPFQNIGWISLKPEATAAKDRPMIG